jgi:hypothetical protein
MQVRLCLPSCRLAGISDKAALWENSSAAKSDKPLLRDALLRPSVFFLIHTKTLKKPVFSCVAQIIACGAFQSGTILKCGLK